MAKYGGASAPVNFEGQADQAIIQQLRAVGTMDMAQIASLVTQLSNYINSQASLAVLVGEDVDGMTIHEREMFTCLKDGVGLPPFTNEQYPPRQSVGPDATPEILAAKNTALSNAAPAAFIRHAKSLEAMYKGTPFSSGAAEYYFKLYPYMIPCVVAQGKWLKAQTQTRSYSGPNG